MYLVYCIHQALDFLLELLCHTKPSKLCHCVPPLIKTKLEINDDICNAVSDIVLRSQTLTLELPASVRVWLRETVYIQYSIHTWCSISENCGNLLSSTRFNHVMSVIHLAGLGGQAFRSKAAPPLMRV